MATFQKDQAATFTQRGLSSEYLGLTAAEYQILTGETFEPSTKPPVVRKLWEFYGYTSSGSSNSWKDSLAGAPEFSRRTGIAYTDLIQLVTTAFINPNYPQGDALALFQRIPFSFATLAALVQANFSNPDPNVLAALSGAEIDLPTLVAWSNANYQKISKLIVLEAPDATCDLETTRLQHLDGTLLDDPEVSRMHRFIRLWRKLGWSIADVDRALTAVGASDITPEILIQLARIKQLQTSLNISDLQVLLSLWSPINARGEDSLYNRLFFNKSALNKNDPEYLVFQPAADGSVLTAAGLNIQDHIPALLAALRLSAGDLGAIRADAGLNADDVPLNLGNVSVLYRYAALAKALRLRISDFIALRTLSGSNPFFGPDETLRFASIVSSVQASGFAIPQLNYLYRHLTSPPANLAPQSTTILLLAKTLRDGLTKIARDNLPVPDPMGDVTRAKLALLFDQATVNQTIAMINGSAVYSAPLANLPDAIAQKNQSKQLVGVDPTKVPASVAKKVSYDPQAKVLRFQGAITASEQSALLGVSADPPYQAAVTNLFQQPVTFIQNALSGFLNTQDAARNLAADLGSLDQDLNPVLLDQNGNPTTDLTKAGSAAIASKFAYLLNNLLPYLITQLSHALAKQTISDALKLDSAMAQALLETLLNSTADASQRAMGDLLALQTGGLTGSYFSSGDLTGTPAVQTDADVAFDGDVRTIPKGMQSARWSGMLLAPNNGSFTFAVQTNGKAQLCLGDAATLQLSLDSSTNEWVSAPVSLKAGQLYYLRLEVTQLLAQHGAVQLFWQSASMPKALIPSDNLYPSAVLDAFGAIFTRLHKAAFFVNTFKLADRELAYLATPAPPSAGVPPVDLNALPLARDPANARQVERLDQNAPALFAAWQRVNNFVTLRNSLPQGEIGLVDVFTGTSLDDAQMKLAQATAWDPQVISALVGGAGGTQQAADQGFNLGLADLQNEVWPTRLQVCIRLIKRLGVSPSHLFKWASLDSDFGTLEGIAQEIKKTVQAKYDEETWLTVAKPLNDPVRDSQRAALVAYLLPRMKLADSNQLFEYFLIDADMGVCMETSRAVQAISSVQLFVQRCLMNLEERADDPSISVSPSQIDADQWEQWRKQYRVFQANRKVFLYPENWLESELRDDKSPFFKEFESELLQNELTADNAETAFLNYLENLDQVARLEVMGEYWEDVDPDTGEQVNILHVFARTFNAPHVYFYRRLLNLTTWTPWEKMQVDIQGDHLIPVIWNRRLYLFWPQFAKKAAPPTGTPSIDLKDGSVSAPTPQPYWEISLNWSEYKQGKWSAKQVAKQTLQLSPNAFFDDDPTKYLHYRYVFKAGIVTDTNGHPENLFIRAGYHDQGTDTDEDGRTYSYNDFNYVGEFDIGGCAGDTITANTDISKYGDHYPVTPAGADFEAMTFVEQPAQSSLIMTGQDRSQTSTYLQKTPTPYRLLYPCSYFLQAPSFYEFQDYLLQAPFFYEDTLRTYFVAPVERYSLISQIYNPNYVHFSAQLNVAATATLSPALTGTRLATPSATALLSPGATVPRGMLTISEKLATNPAPRTAAITRRLAPPLSDGSKIAPKPTVAGSAVSVPVSATSRVVGFAAQSRVNTWGGIVTGGYNAWLSHAAAQSQIIQYSPPQTDLQFSTFYHPFVCEFMKSLTRRGIPGLLTEQDQQLGNSYVYFPWKAGQLITTGATGPGCIIESSFGKGSRPGNFEVVVLKGNELWHYWHDNSDVSKPWAQGQRITDRATGPGWIIQSDIRNGWNGNFEVVVPEGNQLVHYWHDNADVNSPWVPGRVITTKASGPGCIIQSSFRPPGLNDDGNFESVALEGDQLVHYWHDNFGFFFDDAYNPTSNLREPFPREEVDFCRESAYSLYNWELFFHAPMLIATRLTQNRRFADARTWFHYVFNPTDDSPDEVSPARYWKVLPFKTSPRDRIQNLMVALDNGDLTLVQEVNCWAKNPFQPFRIARQRLIAFQKNVFMKYLDNLIAWGDQLFGQDTMESVNQAQQLYILAADLLGPRPQQVPPRAKPKPETYASLKAPGGKLDAFSNAQVQLENEFPYSGGVSSGPNSQNGGLLGLIKTLYFCIPQNEKLLAYWDIVADRLFKIRNCMNIQGVIRQLPLFAPPIDPALLVQAAAQGVDLSSVLSDISAPLPNYRCTYMLQKALEMCAECRSLGGALLSALEKNDAEGLALLRATQETNIQTLMKVIKTSQLEEAQDQVQALQKSREVAKARYQYYQLLLTGATPDVPELTDSNAPGIPVVGIPTQQTLTSDGGTRLLEEEQNELDSSHSARDWQVLASTMEILSGLSHYVPTFKLALHFWGLGADVAFGGLHIGPALAAVARQQMNLSAQDTYSASHAGKMAGYFRRQQEWSLQSNLAANEIMQIDQQTLAAKVRAAIADYELNTLYPQQLQNAQDIQDFLTNKKYTNQDLYGWMTSDISTTYFQCYQMAYDLAKKAERGYRFERGLTDSNFIQFGYWDSLRKGLQSGERLYLALKQMEQAYLDHNKREYEITKNVSLMLHDPLALIALKQTGKCEVFLPEALFDADYPGHYMRRIKSLSLTIPCVVGPYTSINCTLTLLSNKTRISSVAGSQYAEDTSNGDPRFVNDFAALQSIATSHAQGDSGMFELKLDERYLPFEGAGVISRWRIEMPIETNALDRNTLTDVIFLVKYTAREGGDILRNAALAARRALLADAQNSPLARLFSLKHEFPTEWYRFLQQSDPSVPTQTMQISLGYERFPFQFRGQTIQINQVDLFLSFKDPQRLAAYQGGTPLSVSLADGGSSASGALKSDPGVLNGLPYLPLALSAQLPPAISLTLSAAVTDLKNIVDAVEDLVMVCHYAVSAPG
jgi:hypothetical protein